MSKGRLPSFRGPRDLSLGAKSDGTSRKTPGLSKSLWPTDSDKKKKFTPNLNVTRKEVKAPSESATTTSKSASGWDKSSRTNQRHSKHSKPDLIQTSGTVFADGIGNDSGKRKSGWGSSREGGGDYEAPSALERPKIDLNASFNKVEEEEKLRKLLRDDFIDDLKTGHLVPVQLPMINTGKVFENEAKLENVDKKKKIPELDSDDDEEDIKPMAAAAATPADKKETTLIDLIDKKMSELLFFQMPDHFPGSGSGAEAQAKETNQVLDSLSDGYLGKLQVTKSGKVQLWMNNLLFDVDIGTQVGFLQELFSIENEDQDQGQKGSMTNLGRVRNRVVVMPAWNDLLQAANVNDESASSSDSD